jgi:hypothetical protein
MAYDPRDRLKRPLLGGRLLKEEKWISAIFSRLDFSGSVVNDSREYVPRRDLKPMKAERTLRRSRKSTTVGPYAPQLIRLIRRRFRLETVRGMRKKYLTENGALTGQEMRKRVDWRALVKESLAEWQPVHTGSPVRERVRHFVIRPSRWALLPKGVASVLKKGERGRG